MTKNKRKALSPDEKSLRAIQALFILHATQIEMGGHDMRKVLGVAMKDITQTKKIIDKALSNHGKNTKKGNS